jgi:diguanylate cyclase (GGDEF)-like protein
MSNPLVTTRGLPTGQDFHEASTAVLEYLQRELPLGAWAVTRVDGDDWVMLEVRDSVYGVAEGAVLRWSDSVCSRMVVDGPLITPDVHAVPEYAGAPILSQLDISTYVGVPITHVGGRVFGTLCGIDPAVGDEQLAEHGPLLEMLGQLLGTILESDLRSTELERTAEQHQLDAETDVLTKLLNRRGWDARVSTEEARTHRFGGVTTLLICDLDDLKTINDVEGHAAGDAHLEAVAHGLRWALRPQDTIARIGGDEFGVILRGVRGSVAEEIVARLTRTLDAEGLHLSIGAAQMTVGTTAAATLVEADEQMYAAKASRKGSAARTASAPAA